MEGTRARILLTPRGLRQLADLASRPPQLWALSLLKSLRRRAKRRKEPLRLLEPHQLEGLLISQDFCCAFSGRRLILPGRDDLREGSYDHWLRDLSWPNYCQAAVLTRLNAAEPWERGNLMFLCAPWAAIHESFKDLSAAVLEIRQVADHLSAGEVVVLPADRYYEVLART